MLHFVSIRDNHSISNHIYYTIKNIRKTREQCYCILVYRKKVEKSDFESYFHKNKLEYIYNNNNTPRIAQT